MVRSSKVRSLGRHGVLVIGRLPSSLVRHWASSVRGNLEVVLTGERRFHYLARHPEMAPLERLLPDVVLDPDIVCADKSREQVAVFFRQHTDEHYLRVAVLMQRKASGYKHSVLSFRLAKEQEYWKSWGEVLWKRRGE